MKILLAVDGSAYTKRMLAYLAAHDDLLGPTHAYTVFTAIAPVPAFAAEFLNRTMIEGYEHDLSEHVFAPIGAFVAQQGWKANFVHRSGHAAETIAAEAKAGNYDLVIMGSHGQTALANVVLGSVATRVLASCTAPVLLIR
jgi:nucleotide-binding universal stress UspA family protein